MNLDDFAIDESKLRGVWWDWRTKQPCPGNVPHAEHFSVLVVPKGPEFHGVLAELLGPHVALRRANKLASDQEGQIVGTALARTVLKDWRNGEVGGKPFGYSPENAVVLMTQPRWLLLRRFVDNAASSEAALLADAEKDAEAN